MIQSEKKSEFQLFLENHQDKNVYFEPLDGNHGDTLILMGAKHVLQKARIRLTEQAKKASLIVINGSGGMNDIWMGGLEKLKYYRKTYPDTPLVVGPSSYRFENFDFNTICKISQAPLTLFAREHFSEELLRQICMPAYVTIKVSPDLAFELCDTKFIADLKANCRAEHMLIAMRKDREGSAGVLAKTRIWLTGKLRRPLSKIRDRLVAFRSHDVIAEIMRQEQCPQDIPKIYRDVSSSLSFDEFLSVICRSAFTITDRLHVGILSHLLNKRVILRPGIYHKIRGVYEMSLSGPNSLTILWSK